MYFRTVQLTVTGPSQYQVFSAIIRRGHSIFQFFFPPKVVSRVQWYTYIRISQFMGIRTVNKQILHHVNRQILCQKFITLSRWKRPPFNEASNFPQRQQRPVAEQLTHFGQRQFLLFLTSLNYLSGKVINTVGFTSYL